MRWQHIIGLVIAAAMVVICKMQPNCTEHSQEVVQLANTIAAGIIGNAMATNHPNPKQTKTD